MVQHIFISFLVHYSIIDQVYKAESNPIAPVIPLDINPPATLPPKSVTIIPPRTCNYFLQIYMSLMFFIFNFFLLYSVGTLEQ